MARAVPKKKFDSEFLAKTGVQKVKPVAKAKAKKRLLTAKPRELRNRGWMVVGFDTSMSSLAAAAIGYDNTLKKLVGPEFVYLRWSKEDEYFDRLNEASRSHELVQDLQHSLGLIIETNEIFIAQEEPVPLGMFNKGVSAFLKQQCEISGAFLGGLVRYGFENVWQINSHSWRGMIAGDLGITTHHSKWRSPELALKYNCKPTDSGKFRSKQWAMNPGYAFMGMFPNEIPDWEDIVETKDGKKPRPEGSKAKAVQPDDRYDALAVMWWLFEEISESTLDKLTHR